MPLRLHPPIPLWLLRLLPRRPCSLGVQLDKLEAITNTAKLEEVVDAQNAAVTALGNLEELMIAKFPFEASAAAAAAEQQRLRCRPLDR